MFSTEGLHIPCISNNKQGYFAVFLLIVEIKEAARLEEATRNDQSWPRFAARGLSAVDKHN